MTLPSKNPVLHTSSPVSPAIPLAYSGCAFFWFSLIGDWRMHQRLPRLDYETRVEVVVLLAIGCFLFSLGVVQQRAELGAEGIQLRWFGRKLSFFSYANIQRATPNGPRKVTLEMIGGKKKLELDANVSDDAAAKDVLDRFWQALSAGALEGSRGLEREMLARSGRTTASYRKALRELGGPSSYRQTHLSRDRLLAIAENPGITTEIRTAAVIALSANELDPALRDRLRAAGTVTVEPHLRALLEQISEPGATLDEAACDLALDAVPKP